MLEVEKSVSGGPFVVSVRVNTFENKKTTNYLMKQCIKMQEKKSDRPTTVEFNLVESCVITYDARY
jgi:hypothetical protein